MSDSGGKGRYADLYDRIKAALADVYEPAGVHIWLARVHKSGPLAGHRPVHLIAEGRGEEVLAVAESLSGQIAT